MIKAVPLGAALGIPQAELDASFIGSGGKLVSAALATTPA